MKKFEYTCEDMNLTEDDAFNLIADLADKEFKS